MNSWKLFKSGNTTTINYLFADKIIDAIGNELQLFYSFKEKKLSQRTRLIKDTLCLLGDSLNYKVYANGISDPLKQKFGGKFQDTEWLFDIHWYTEIDSYVISSIPLVVESEWGKKRKKDKINDFSSIKYDFQKLLLANAQLRLMIFKFSKDKNLEELDSYFSRCIETYSSLEQNAAFLFIGFQEKTKSFHYTIKFKK